MPRCRDYLRRAGVGLVALAAAPVATAHIEGAPPAHTGGFGEATCRECHFQHPLNAGDGELRIVGLPQHYIASRRYRLRLCVQHPGLARAGFQLSARFVEGEASGGQAGVLTGTSAGLQRVHADTHDPAYLTHSRKATALEGESNRVCWRIRWQAPSRTAGPVVFHATANAANDDASALGDWIYSAEARVAAPP